MSLLKEKKSWKTEEAKEEAGFYVPIKPMPAGLPEVVVGQLLGFDGEGRPLVNYAGNPQVAPLPAMTTGILDESSVGSSVALLFTGADPTRPMIIGVIRDQQNKVADEPEEQTVDLTAQVDGKHVEITGEEEIVLKCGKASITLTKSGKILIRGKHILSRSSGANRIKGGSVQIN